MVCGKRSRERHTQKKYELLEKDVVKYAEKRYTTSLNH